MLRIRETLVVARAADCRYSTRVLYNLIVHEVKMSVRVRVHVHNSCLFSFQVRDHFIFNVESTGALQPDDIFLQAVDILAKKCDHFLSELDA